MATFGSATLPPHHSHFQHHVRTKGWGIEPGWKIVSRNIEERRNFTVQPSANHETVITRNLGKKTDNFSSGGGNNNSSRRSSSGITGLRERNVNSGVTDRERFTHFENGIGRMKPPKPSSSSSSSSLSSSVPTWRIGASKEDICPIHDAASSSTASSAANIHWFSSVGRAAGSFGGRNYSSQRPSILPTVTTTASRAQSPVDPRRYSPPPSSVASSASSTGSGSLSSEVSMPPGVLKKPGSGRSGPKHMKKVAFLENAEFSRGIP